MTHIQQSTMAGKVVLENADDYSIRAEWVGTDQTESLRYVSGSSTAVHPHYWPHQNAGWHIHCLEGSR